MNDMHVSRIIRKGKEIVPQKINSKSFMQRCSRYSNMAYLSEESIREKLSEEGARKIFVYAYEGMLAFMSEFEDEIVVSFRGIGTLDEFKTILKFWKNNVRGVNVHHGFYESVEKFAQFVINDINTISLGKKIVYTGHSFGGAMALLLTLYHKPDMIYTFGAPRAGGGEEYRQIFKDVSVYRVETKRDFVTHLPPKIPYLLEYDSIGEPIVLEGINHPYETHRMMVYTKSVRRKERD